MSGHSLIFKLSGNTSTLTSEFSDPIVLEDNVDYGIGLTNFETYHSFPNVIEGVNNKMFLGPVEIELPTGAYELEDIEEFIKKRIAPMNFKLKGNRNTLKCHLECDYAVLFTRKGTLAPLLGFHNIDLDPGREHISANPVNIMTVNAVCIDCNIATGSYDNGIPGHLIYHFYPLVPVGAKIVESPDTLIYLPITVKEIRSLIVKIVDQDGQLLNLRGETVTVGLHLKAV